MKPGVRNRFVEGLQERRARHKERHHLIRVAAAIGGFLVVLLGIIVTVIGFMIAVSPNRRGA